MIVVGVDQSLRRTAVAALPLDFAGDLSRLELEVIAGEEFDLETAASPEARARRTMLIASRLAAFLKRLGGPRIVRCVYFEGYAFDASYGGEALGEVAGVCKAKLVALGYRIAVITASHTRKILLGKVPSNHPKTVEKRLAAGGPGKINAKKEVKRVLDAAGAGAFGWKKLDEYDALALANAGVHAEGGVALVQVSG